MHLIARLFCVTLILLFATSGYAVAQQAVIKSASELDYPPFSVTQKNGSADGFSVELMRAALQRMGRDASFEVAPWYEIKSRLAAGELDALPLVDKTPESKLLFDFTSPYLTLYGAVFVHQDNTDIHQLSDLEHKRVGVMKSDSAEEFMAGSQVNAQLVRYKDYTEAFLALAEQSLDAVVVQRLVGLKLIKSLDLDNIKIAINPLTSFRQQFCFAVTRGNRELLNMLEEGLTVTIADGTYDQLREKWMSILDRENLHASFFFRVIVSVLGLLTFLVIAFILIREKKLVQATLNTLTEQNAILAAIPDMLFEVDEEGRFLRVWTIDESELAVQKEELIGQKIDQIMPEEEARKTMQALQDASNEGVSRGQQIRIPSDHGEHWFEISVARKSAHDAHQNRYIILSRNISDRKLNEDQLSISANVFKHAREGIIITDADGTILNINDSFTHVTGYTRRETLGKKPSFLASGHHTPGFYSAMWQELNRKGHWYGEITNKRKNGEIYIQFLSITTSYDTNGNVKNYVGIFSDITKQKENQKKLEHIAHYDALTQLPNRVLLGDRLNQLMIQSVRRKQYLAVVFLDLDGFKEVNDQFGHQTGDILLSTMAKRLNSSLREGDTIARIGGDEFIAVLSDLEHIDDSLPYLTRLLHAASTPVIIQKHEIQLSASLGVAFYFADKNIDADLLIRQADQAMYQAKLAGKNQYHLFDSDKDQIIREKYEDLESISLALEEDQFTLYYQPKVHMRSGEIIGLEALIRWHHPKKGLLLPGEFLSVVEGNPLAIKLGEWVLENVLLQIEQWRNQGYEARVSVNISANHLLQQDFTRRLHEMISQHPTIHAGQLEIEILETNALEDINYVSNIIKECRDIGIQFALDDFGTGYSSLSYLKRLPVTTLKVDRSFVRDILFDPDDLSILEGIISMASAFKLEVISEGVESIEQGRLLLQLGCEYAQGFCIARPMPPEKIINWMQNYQPDPKWQQQSAVNKDDIPLLIAGIEHNAWIRQVMEYLDGRVSVPAELDQHQCRFGRWLDGEGRKHYQHNSNFEQVIILHRKIHKLATQLVKGNSDTRSRAQETRKLSQYKSDLIEKLNQILDINN